MAADSDGDEGEAVAAPQWVVSRGTEEMKIREDMAWEDEVPEVEPPRE